MPVTLKPLAEQAIVITGASSGIGLAAARRAARAGARVFLVARNEAALEEAVAGIRARGGRAAHLAIDVTEKDAPQRIGDAVDRAFGGFDTWVNDAAVALFGKLEETTMEEHRRIFDVGYFALVNASLYAVRRLAERGGGTLINVGSVLSERSMPLQGAYSAMKHAVLGFTEALRMELEADGKPVSVTLVKPAGMNTPYPEHARNKLDKPARIPPLVYDPELSAKAICFAAEHRKRDLTVGGQGYLLTKVGNAMPRTMDRVMERFFGENAQTIDQGPEPGTKDNLMAPRRDGRIESNQDIYVRRQSLALEAQMRPLAAAAVLGGIGAAAAAGLMLLRRSRRDGRRNLAPEGSRPLGAHQADGTDSSASFAARIADEGTIPDARQVPMPAR